MAVLSLSLLGPFNALLGDQPLYNFKTNKVQALLIYLAIEKKQPHRRENLMTLLWPDMPLESAQVNLRQTIYRLRQAIPEVSSTQGKKDVNLIVSDRQKVTLNPEADIRLDVDEFLTGLEGDPAQAATLYRGNFLADFYLIDSNEFENWAEQWRENLRRKALAVLEDLTEANLNTGQFDRAQTYAWRQLEFDPLRERAYRQLMIALASSGQRNAAISQYHLCRQRLENELGLEPSLETTQLYEHIQADALRQTRKPVSPRKIDQQNMPVFLLTDIEGSTRLWDTHHQAMLPALFQHNQILEENIVRHGGRILELRGDGVKAVFENCNPLQCMLDIQKALGDADWGEIGDLRIRIGLHGVPAIHKGHDYFKEDDRYYGPVLNHTARIMDSGWGGQILVSEQVHHTFSLPAGASWQDFGLHRVKSLDQPLHIYGLLHPILPRQTFPPLRTMTTDEKLSPAEAVKTNPNLPPQATAFVGRQKELADLAGLLDQPQTRLVSIIGPGGMGKTRLAIAAAESQITKNSPQNGDSFRDGVFFVALASISDADQIPLAIAKAVNIPVEPSQGTERLERTAQESDSPLDKLLAYLQNKHALLILDNFEHLLEGVNYLPLIFSAAPDVRVLVTSRERLHLQEEQVFPIQGLEFPDWEAPEYPDEYTAMELFLQSAQRVRPDFSLSAEDMVHLTRICQLVGGMPLGLELAASWVDILSVDEIVAEIKGSPDFLETDIRNIPDRHRSIRAVFDSSWNRLNETEQCIFAHLSIFRGRFNRAAAQKVSQASIRDLATLVSKSLLQYDQSSGNYQLHELLRQYGAEKLGQNPVDEANARHLHSKHYCEQARRHLTTLMGGESQHAFTDIEVDFDNIQMAWDWAIKNEFVENVDKAIDMLCMYFSWNWSGKEALEICNAVIDMLVGQKNGVLSTGETSPALAFNQRVYAKALGWRGYFLMFFDHAEASKNIEQSIATINSLLEQGFNARLEKALLLFFQGILKYYEHELLQAKKYFQESLSLSQEINYLWLMLRNLIFLGDLARISGAPREAQKWAEQCLIEARAQNNCAGEINALLKMGWAARSLLAYDEAKSLYEQGLALSRTYQDQSEATAAIESLGFLAMFLGKQDEAVTRFREGMAISKEMGLPKRAAHWQVHIGIATWLNGDLEKAAPCFKKAIDIGKSRIPETQIFASICYAEYLTITGAYRQATEQLQIVESIAKVITVDRFISGRQKRVQGWVALGQKQYAQAKMFFEQSIELFQSITDDEQVAWSQAGLARAMIGLGDWEEARQLLTEALWTSIEIQGFIPLVFTLPITVLYLSQENPGKAQKVYQEILHAPLLAKAQYFEDIVYRFLPDRSTATSTTMSQPVRDLPQQLMEVAAEVLSDWIQVWMEEPDMVKKKEST